MVSGLAVFATYSTYQTLSYFTPYFTNVLGATVVGSGAIAIIRTYGIRIVGAPLGGYMGDRIHSVSSVIATVLACGAVITLIFMFMPAGVPSVLLTVMTLVIGFMVHIARGAMFAVPSEVKIPRRYAASTAGRCLRHRILPGSVSGSHVRPLAGHLRQRRIYQDFYLHHRDYGGRSHQWRGYCCI